MNKSDYLEMLKENEKDLEITHAAIRKVSEQSDNKYSASDILTAMAEVMALKDEYIKLQHLRESIYKKALEA